MLACSRKHRTHAGKCTHMDEACVPDTYAAPCVALVSRHVHIAAVHLAVPAQRVAVRVPRGLVAPLCAAQMKHASPQRSVPAARRGGDVANANGEAGESIGPSPVQSRKEVLDLVRNSLAFSNLGRTVGVEQALHGRAEADQRQDSTHGELGLCLLHC